MLHHDNAPSHSSRMVMDTVNKLGVELLPHPPHSPDLAICDFWLFPNLKNRLRGNKYESREELRCAVNKHTSGRCHVTACSTCSGHGSNGGMRANYAKDVTLKRSSSQM